MYKRRKTHRQWSLAIPAWSRLVAPKIIVHVSAGQESCTICTMAEVNSSYCNEHFWCNHFLSSLWRLNAQSAFPYDCDQTKERKVWVSILKAQSSTKVKSRWSQVHQIKSESLFAVNITRHFMLAEDMAGKNEAEWITKLGTDAWITRVETDAWITRVGTDA